MIITDVRLESEGFMRVKRCINLIVGCLIGLTRMHNFTVARTGRCPNGAFTLQDNYFFA